MAVAYSGLFPAAYLAVLRRPGLLDHPSLTGADYSPTGHDRHVARTFALSYGRLDDANATDATARHLLAWQPHPRHVTTHAQGRLDETAAGLCKPK
jgi:hypothetical protein